MAQFSHFYSINHTFDVSLSIKNLSVKNTSYSFIMFDMWVAYGLILMRKPPDNTCYSTGK